MLTCYALLRTVVCIHCRNSWLSRASFRLSNHLQTCPFHVDGTDSPSRLPDLSSYRSSSHHHPISIRNHKLHPHLGLSSVFITTTVLFYRFRGNLPTPDSRSSLYNAVVVVIIIIFISTTSKITTTATTTNKDLAKPKGQVVSRVGVVVTTL